ncbi:MAG: phosphatidylglycerophosphatase A [Holophagales bacterium]|nr:phosphatidylglycerophosphatase A [Holophagales bacterium]
MSRRAPRRPVRRGDVEDASAELPAAQEVPWREVFRRAPLATLLATGFGSGLLPGAPGTWGSLLAVVLGEGLFQAVGLGGVTGLAAVSVLVGVPVSGRVATLRGLKDPGEIVVDEIAGQAIALAGLHAVLPAAASAPLRWVLVVVAFGLFRAFDILKPGPVNRLQSLPGGWGVMADDLLAGVLAGILAGFAAFLLS